MEMIFGTGNHGKFMMMKDFLEELNVDLISLDDLPGVEESPEESGSTPLENARMKAEYYYRIFQKPVFPVTADFISMVFRRKNSRESMCAMWEGGGCPMRR